MKIKTTFWALALTSAFFVTAEPTPSGNAQPTTREVRETQTTRVRLAGGAKRSIHNRTRPATQRDLTESESAPATRRRAGGVKSRRVFTSSPRNAQPTTREVRETQTTQVRRAGGVKRSILNRTRPATQRDLTESESAPATRRRAGGVKSRW
ncbi:MAG: hypothetical protein JJU29_10305 [Verrucomicrobia bacterium]|nr:hypothetical protein [Verrucomicrobiota bacterium]MCH8513439.1 hypothetical protein [Kiritimatiellia bacterium]